MKNNSPIIQTAKVGRPPKVTPAIKQFINTETIDDPRIGGVKLSEKIAISLGVRLSSTTINQIRNSLKFSYIHPRRRQFLNEKQIQNRISFCQNQLEGEIDWSEMVVFSDESRFCLRDDSRRVWVKRGYYNEKTFCNENKYDHGVMVWGAIGKGWRSHLILVKGRLNANGYMEMLDEYHVFDSLNNFYGQNQFYFEQDGATAHRAKKTLNWIHSQKVNVIEDWPANSPDLTCIEQVWSLLEQRIRKYQIKNLSDLYSALVKEWYLIPQNQLDRLISSTPDRFMLCINENGKAIGYKLHTIKKQEIFDCKNVFINQINSINTEINKNSENSSPILDIPFNQKRDMTFCSLITNRLLKNDLVPYILKVENSNYLAFDNYNSVIKHHVSIPSIINKIKKGEYESTTLVKMDIDLMWTNIEMLFGNQSEIAQNAKTIKNDIDLAWNLSIENQE